MISRKALLVSAPSGRAAHANSDVQTTRNFLLSPRGGAWSGDEIIVLEQPTLREVTEAVKNMSADYTITFFSGSSFSDPQGRRFLVLNDGDFFQDTELLNDSEKQLVLVDACPERFSEEVLQFVGKPDEIQLARQMYDKWIERCEAGQVIMHACDGQPSKAGAFTRKLMQVAREVPSVENRFNLKSILAAGHEVPVLMKEEGIAQSPDISYSSGNAKLPFALALPILRRSAGNSDGIAGFALGLLLLGLLFGPDQLRG